MIFREGRTFGHHRGRARDRVGEIEILDRRTERRLVRRSANAGETADVGGVARLDLVEAESELVAGFMVEYGSTPYMMFMLGEYVAIGTMCAMGTILFLGGWLPPFPVPPFTWIPGVIWFVLKAFFLFFLFAMVKAMVPRYRYDQLMRLGWKVFLPASLAMVAMATYSPSMNSI